MSRLLGSVRRPWMVALFAILAVAISFLITSTAQAAPPVNSAYPSINSFTGYGPTNNRTATVTAGSWTADETPTLSYQWYRCYASGAETTTLPADCYIVNNRTNSDYGINQTDVGWYLRVAETATTSGGNVTVYSATTSRVLASRILSSWYTSNCAVKNGGVWCWGNNFNGQLGDNSISTQRNTPVAVLKSDLTPLTGAVAVATSNTHTCAVTNDKSLWCWGANAAGQLGDGTTTATKTAVKVKASSGVDLTDIVDVTVAGDASNSLQSGFTCAINTSGALLCWGLNSSGQLGTGNTTSASYPTAVTDMTSGVNQVAVNDKSACAIKNGAAFCWGLNGSGQLGIGNTTNKTTPTAVTTLTSNTTGITMGALSACAIRAGAAFCWGDNVTGNLGTGNTTLSNVPVAAISTADSVPVSLSSGVIDIASNENGSNSPYNTTCFLKESGAVICTGYNQYRQLTNNSNAPSNTPVRSVYYTSNVSEIDMGQYSFCAIMSGAVRCLGATPVAGDGTANSPTTPSNVSGMTGLAPESYSPNVSTSTIAPATYVGTGQSLSSVTPNEMSGYPSPSPSYQWLVCTDNTGGAGASIPTSCASLAGATASSLTLTADHFGKYLRLQTQVTDGTVTRGFVSAPSIASGTPPNPSGTSTYSGTQAAGLIPGLPLTSSTTVTFTGTPTPTASTAWVRCTSKVNSDFSSAIDGTLPAGCAVISGATSTTYKLSASDIGFFVSPAQIATTSAGQTIAVSASTDRVRGGQRIAMSANHSCAIKSGLVYCWGINTSGQLGDGTTTSTTKPGLSPVRFSDGSLLTDVIAISISTNHSCALTNDGNAYCWGANTFGQLGNGTTTQQNYPTRVLASSGTPLTEVTTLTAGLKNSCFVKSAQLYCAGANASGQIGKGVAEASTNYLYPLLNSILGTGVQQVVANAEELICAIKSAQAYCWGSYTYSNLGFSSAGNVATPTLLVTPANVVTLSLGKLNGCLVASADLYCWGSGTYGANGTGGSVVVPTLVKAVPKTAVQLTTSIGGNGTFTCLYTINEDVYCAGDNTYYAAPYDIASGGLTVFRKTGTIAGIAEIASGDRATCFVVSKTLKCVGSNTSGVIGFGSNAASYYPYSPAGMDNYIGSADLAPIVNLSTSGFATSNGTLIGKAEDSSGSVTLGFPYPSFSKSWNTCTEIGEATSALPGDCSATSSATGDTLVLSSSDSGSKFRYSVTASNSIATVTKTTATIGPVQTAPTTFNSNPSISMVTPAPLVGHLVTAVPSEISTEGRVDHNYQWYRCSASDSSTADSLPSGCTLIPDGTTKSYQIRPEDTGSFLRFSDTAKAGAGDLIKWSPTTTAYVMDGQSVSSNGTSTCAIRQGMVQCWGAAGTVQGDGVGAANTAPLRYVSISAGVRLTDVVSVSVGQSAACAITVSGALYCWGPNSTGAMGDGTVVGKFWATPVSPTAGGVSFSSGVLQVSTGISSTCAIKYGGAVYCWGSNISNVLGNSSLQVNTNYTVPQETTRAAALGISNTGATKVIVGQQHACIIQGGFIYCVGYGGYGQLYNGSNTNNTSFDKFLYTNNFWANGGFTDVAISGNSTCFIQSGGVRCVGQSTNYLNGTTNTTTSDGKLVFNEELWSGSVSISGYKETNGGQVGYCASKLDSNYCWGVNTSGQDWGLITTPLTTPTKLPVYVKQLALGLGNACGIVDETLSCVGSNTTGALGNGTQVSSATPVSTGITSGVGTYYADPAAVTQTFTGTLASGSVLTAAQKPFTGYPRPTMSYQWYRCLKVGNSVNVLPTDCFAISGATGETYTVTSADLGKRLRFGATGVLGGTTLRNFSAASVAVGVVPVSMNSSVKLIGTTLGTQVGTTFQQSKALFNGTPSPTISYKWLRCTVLGAVVLTSVPVNCREIPGATSISYTTTVADINYMIRGQQIATNEIGSATLITPSTGFINEGDRIAVADGTTCVIKDGAVWCVGAGTRGQLGNGTWLDSNVPVQVKRTVSTNLTNVRHITGAGTHFCAITWNAQAVFCWGSNTYGELGFTAGTDYNYATQVTSVLLAGIVGSLSVGPTSTCATTTNGLICWGNKVNGLLGNGQSTGSQSSSAAPAGFTSDANRVSVGATSACGIKLGALFCWGLNTYGQLGDGTNTTRLAPVAVSGATSGVSDVAVGSSATCAVINSAAKCWGNNDFGQLGNGTNTANGAPTTISNASDGTSFDSGVTDISMSSNSTSPTQDSVCVTKASGAVYCFGYNGEGQLLNGETTSTNVAKPALVATSGVTSVAVGSDHSCFIKNNSAYCSGANTQGQLLDSTTTASATPVNVSTFSSISAFGSSPGAASTAPFIFGNTVKVGKPVQSDPGVVNVSPPPTYTYLWYSCTASSATATTTATVPTGCTVATGPSANTDTYTPVVADKDKYLRMYVGLVQGGTTYPSFTATSAKVLPGEPEITFNPLPGPIIVGGDAVQLTPVSSTGNTAFSYVSSTTSLCTVTSTGMISGVSSGICDIAVTQAAAGAYDAVTVTFSAVTGPGEQTITFAQPDPTQMSLSTFTPTVSASSGLTVALTSSTPSVCTVSGTAVTLVSLGTCTISADQAGNSAYYAAPTETRSFEIIQGSQSLTLSGSNLFLTDETYALPATSSAGLTPTYVTNSSTCSIVGTTLNLLAVGDCAVTASQAGNTNYSAASNVTATFRIVGAPVNDALPTISGTPIFGASYSSNAGVWVGAGTVTISQQWYVCNSAGDAVVGSGNLGANAPSGCTSISEATSTSFTPTTDQVGKRLRLAELASNTTAGTTNYTSAFTATSAVVSKQSQTISFGSLSPKTYGDAAFSLSATSDRSLEISYSSSNTSVCSISGSMLTIVSAGTCDVTASQAGNSGTLGATDVVRTLTVAKADQTITLPNFSAGVYGGAAKASGAAVTSGLTITLSSADTAVCTVSGLNVIQVAPGTCSITASQAGDSNYNAATNVTKSFTIAKASQTISFTGSVKQKPAGNFDLAATTTSGLTIAYASTTTSVCTVSGVTVAPVALGTCSITASQTGDDNYSAATAVSANFTIESVPVQTTVEVIGAAANYRFGTPVTVTAGTWSGTGTVTITRSWYRCETAASISVGTGSAASLAPADCSLIPGASTTSYTPVEADINKFLVVAETASNTTSTGANSRTTFVSTSTAVEKQTQTITFATLTSKTFGDAAFALTGTSSRSLTVTYGSSDTSVCTVSVATVTIVGAGTCDITASQSGNTTTLAATDVVRTLTVNKKSQTITLPDFTAGVYGGAVKASGATTTSGLEITLVSSDTSVCTVSGLNVTQVTPGTCSITAQQAGNANYLSATSVTKSFTIAKASQTITFAGSPKQLPAGDFAAGGSASSGLTVSYSSSTTAVCTVAGSTVTPVALGTCTLVASQAGNTNYLAATSTSASFTIESVPVQTTAIVVNSQTPYMFNKPITTTAGVWAGTASITTTRSWFRCDSQPSISEGIGSVAALTPADCVALAASGSNYIPVAEDIGKYLVVAERASNITSAGTNSRTTFASTATVVQKQTQTLTFGALSSKAYGAAPFSLTGTSDRLLTVSYTSSNTAVCTVSVSTVTVVAPGTCDITASQAGDLTTAAATDVVRTLTVTKASQTISLNNLSAIDFRGTPTSLVYSATSLLDVIVVSNSTSVCTVSGTTVSVVAVGTCSITASQAGDSNFNAATSVTKTFVISKAQDSLTFTGATKQFRSGNFTISASTLSGALVSFASTTTSVCTVSGTTVTPVTHGACVIAATAGTNSNYISPNAVNATFTIERAIEQTAVHSMTAYGTYWYDQQINYTAGTWVGSGTVTVTHTWFVCDSRPTTIVVSGSTTPTGCTAVNETSTGAYKPVAGDIGKFVVLAETASNVTSGVTNTSRSWISANGVVTKWAQVLTFGALANKTFGDMPFTLNGLSDQGQQITYTSSNTAVCTVSGSVVTVVAGGSCDITASQAGTTTVAAATPITQTLTVNKAAQTVSFTSLPDLTYSANPVTAVVTTSSSLSASVISNSTAVCTISGLTISLVKAGTCSITASQGGDSRYLAATSVTRTFAVSKAIQGLTFTIVEFMSLGEHDGLALNGASDSILPITYSVNDSAVCDVQNGRLIPVGPGSCSITALENGDDRFESASVTRTVTIANYAVVDSMVPNGSAFTNSSTTGFTITFDSAITGFTASDLSTVPAGACDIAEPVSVNNDAAVYSVALSNCRAGAVVLKVAANSISNGAPGPALDYIGVQPVTVDFNFLQTLTVVSQFTSPTNRTSLAYNVTFAEDVSGFNASDVTISGTGSANCVAGVTGSGLAYVVTLTGCTDGTVSISIGSNAVTDLAGNSGPSVAVNSASVTVDLIAPVAPVGSGLPDQYSRSTDFNVEFTTLTGNTYHCSLNGVELAGCDGSLTIPASSMTAGDYTLEIWATDSAGNDSTHFSQSWSIGSYERPATPVIITQSFARTAFNHLTINWSIAAARSVELPVSGMLLEYSTNGTTWTGLPTLVADATSYDLTIQSGYTYSFRVRALSGPFTVNASEYSAIATYVAAYQPALTAQSTPAALMKPAAGTTITLTGTDLRDFATLSPTATTGTVVTVTDSANKVFVAKLVSVTSTSIRFTVPTTSKIGAATVKVTVGSGNYAGTSATRNIRIVASKVNQVMTFTAPTATRVFDADTQLAATMDSQISPTFVIEPGSIGICSVSTTGLLHPIKGGICSFKVLAAAGDAFNAFTSPVFSTTVNKLNVGISFELPTELSSTFNQDGKLLLNPNLYQLSAVADVAVPNTTVKVSSAPETVCFVDGELKLHVIAIGTCTITALAENDFYRTEAPVNRIFEIVKSVQVLTYIAPGTTQNGVSAPPSTDSTSGFQLVATLDSGNLPNYETTNSDICTVDPSGLVNWVGDLVKTPGLLCEIRITQDGDVNYYGIDPVTVSFGGTHVAPLPPVGGYVREPDGSLAVGRTGGLAASGNDGVAVVVVTDSKIAITPFSRGIYIGPITATVTIPYYVRVRNVLTLKQQICTIKWGILKKYKVGDPRAFKLKQFPNKTACVANKDAIAWFKTGARLLPTIVVKRDRRWPTTYLAKTGNNGRGPKIWPRIKTWHLTIG